MESLIVTPGLMLAVQVLFAGPTFTGGEVTLTQQGVNTIVRTETTEVVVPNYKADALIPCRYGIVASSAPLGDEPGLVVVHEGNVQHHALPTRRVAPLVRDDACAVYTVLADGAIVRVSDGTFEEFARVPAFSAPEESAAKAFLASAGEQVIVQQEDLSLVVFDRQTGAEMRRIDFGVRLNVGTVVNERGDSLWALGVDGALFEVELASGQVTQVVRSHVGSRTGLTLWWTDNEPLLMWGDESGALHTIGEGGHRRIELVDEPIRMPLRVATVDERSVLVAAGTRGAVVALSDPDIAPLRFRLPSPSSAPLISRDGALDLPLLSGRTQRVHITTRRAEGLDPLPDAGDEIELGGFGESYFYDFLWTGESYSRASAPWLTLLPERVPEDGHAADDPYLYRPLTRRDAGFLDVGSMPTPNSESESMWHGSREEHLLCTAADTSSNQKPGLLLAVLALLGFVGLRRIRR